MSKGTSKECVFILGMHRSGTSAVAGSLYHLGFFLGDSLMAKSDDNPYGYFEENKIVAWNNQILKLAGFNWDDQNAFINVNDFIDTEIVQVIKAYIIQSTKEHEFVAFKDPRFCITLPIWLYCCTQAKIQPKFIFVIRNPEDVAQSLHQRDLFSFKKSYQLYLNHIFKAEKNTRPYDRVIFDFKDLLENPIGLLKNSLQVLDIKTSIFRRRNIVQKVENFIDTKVVHHHSSDDDIQYSIVKLAYQNFQFIQDTAAIDRLRKEFYSGNSIFDLKDRAESIFEAQLFYDTGKGFNETESIVQRVNMEHEEFVFDLSELPADSRIKSFRFDPATIPVQVQIEEVRVEIKKGEVQHLEIDQHNGIPLPSGQFIFLTFDSQMYFKGSSDSIHQLIIKLRYRQIEKNGIGELSTYLERYKIIPKEDFVFLHKKIKSTEGELIKEKQKFEENLKELEQDFFSQTNALSSELQEVRSTLDMLYTLRDSIKENLLDEQKITANRRAQLEDYRKEIEEITTDRKRLERKLVDAQDAYSKLKSEKHETHLYAKKLEHDLSIKQSNLDALSKKMEQLYQTEKSYTRKLAKNKDTIQQFKLNQKEDQLHIQQLNDKLLQHETNIQQSTLQLEKAKQVQLNLDDKIQYLIQEIEEKNLQLSNLKSNANDEIKLLKKALEEKKQLLSESQQNLSQQIHNHQLLQNNFDHYQQQIDLGVAEIARLKELHHQKETVILEQQQHIVSFEERIMNLLQKVDTKQQFTQSLQSDILTIKQEHLRTKHEIATLNTIKEQQKHEIVALNDRKTHLNDSIKAYQNEQQNIYQKLKDYQNQIHELNVRHGENYSLIELQKEELSHKNTSLFNVTNSMSYRIGQFITAPFRFTYDLFPKKVTGRSRFSLYLSFFLVAIQRPFSFLKHLNLKNFRTLIKALRTEDTTTILTNFKALINSKSKTPTLATANALPPNTSNVVNTPSPDPIKSVQEQLLAKPQQTESSTLPPEDTSSQQQANIPSENIHDDIEQLQQEEQSQQQEEQSQQQEEQSQQQEEAAPSTEQASIILHIEYVGFIKKSQIRISGWAIAKQAIQNIEIWNKNKKLGEALIGIHRKDVKEAFPAYNYEKEAGYVFEFSIDELQEVTVKVIDKNGAIQERQVAVQQLPEALRNLHIRETYEVWIENNSLNDQMRQLIRDQQAKFDYRPLISIVIPVYNVAEKWLQIAIDSIKNQLYDNWEICLADDASPKPHVVPFLQQMEASDDRIKVFYRKENGNISAATNSALSIATGEYIAFMDNDDELAEHAFYEIVAALNQNPDIDILYTDEDKVSEEGKRYNPFFKPDWSPELLLSFNYFNHLLCVRKTIVDKVGGLRTAFDGAQDYDFILRIVEQSQKVHHIPKVLYHWRALEGSIAAQGDAKSDNFKFFDKCTGALQAYLERNDIPAIAFHPNFARLQGLGLNHLNWSDSGPLVSIIIPSKNHYDTLKTCIDSIRKTTYKRYEIIIADNASTDKKTLKYLQKIKRKPQIKVLTIPNKGERFSYSYINNQAIKKAKGDYVLLLNDDIEVISPDWLSQMVGFAQLDGVGIVGAKLLYPDDTIQHAGVINGLYPHGYDNLPDHAYKNFPADANGYFFTAAVSCNYAVVTAACLLMPLQLYNSINGLDEEQFGLAYNDVDLCLRVVEKGYRVVYAAQAQLYHYESKSRKNTLHIEEVALFKRKWKHFEDPYYNKNLSKRQLFAINPLSTLAYRSQTIKLLVVTHNLNFEGAPLQMLEIVEGLLAKEDQYQIDIYSPVDGPLKQAYLDLGLDVYIFEDPVTLALHLRQTYEDAITQFSAWMQEKGYARVYANTLVTFFIHEACQKAGIRSLWGIHESSSPQDFYTYLPTALQAKAYESFNTAYALVFVAKATERIFQNFDVRQSSIVINNGLRPERFESVEQKLNLQVSYKEKIGVKEDEVLFLNLGTVCARKGQLDFVKAAVECIQKGMTHAKFLLVGARDEGITGEYLAQINTVIAESQTEDYFIIIGETKEVEQYYIAADIFVCSSYNESYPRVILEAMLFQLPIITTPIFGIVEQVIEHINGLFYMPGDIEQLAKHTMELSVDVDKRKLFTKNAPYVYELINTYEEMIEKYHKLLL